MAKHNFRAVNVPDHFIRHRAFQGELSRLDGTIADFSFTLVKRSNGQVALRSTNFPNRFFRHRDFAILLEAPAGPSDELFRLDSSFFFERGMAGSGVSFRSVNFPDRFIRHRDFRLVLDSPDSDLEGFREDATFIQEPARVLIDHGTELNPV